MVLGAYGVLGLMFALETGSSPGVKAVWISASFYR